MLVVGLAGRPQVPLLVPAYPAVSSPDVRGCADFVCRHRNDIRLEGSVECREVVPSRATSVKVGHGSSSSRK